MPSGSTPEEDPEGPTILEMLLEGRAAPEEDEPGSGTDVNESPEADEDSPEATEPVEDDALLLHREVPRPPVDWDAMYRFHDEPAGQWRECRVSDISTSGARLRFFDVTAEQMEGRRIEVQVQLFGDVRNIEMGMKRDGRAGIEFVDLMEDSSNSGDSPKHSDSRW